MFDFDFSKFPKPRDGFYFFQSAGDLVAALPHQPSDTDHVYGFNCFDTVIALAGELFRTNLRPDGIAGPFLVPHLLTTNSLVVTPRATARDAFNLAYPSWYREATEAALPGAMGDLRISLTAALIRCYLLPESTTEGQLSARVMEALRASWSGLELSFPTTFEVVLCHEVNLPQHWFVTAHAGLLFHGRHGYTYVEKCGGSGPFVRLDFSEKAALLIWLGGIFRGAEKLGYTHHFATFNDRKVEILEALKK